MPGRSGKVASLSCGRPGTEMDGVVHTTMEDVAGGRASPGRWSRSSCATARTSVPSVASESSPRRPSWATRPTPWHAVSPAGSRGWSPSCSTTCTTRSSPRPSTGSLHASESMGYRLLLGAGSDRRQTELAAMRGFLEYRPDGIVLVSPRLPSGAIAAVAASVPVVVIGRSVRADGVDSVMTDERGRGAPRGRPPDRARSPAHRAHRRWAWRRCRPPAAGVPPGDGAAPD